MGGEPPSFAANSDNEFYLKLDATGKIEGWPDSPEGVAQALIDAFGTKDFSHLKPSLVT